MVTNVGPASPSARPFGPIEARADWRDREGPECSHRGTLHDARGAVATIQALLATRLEPEGELESPQSDFLGAVALEVAHLSRLLDRELDRPEPETCDLAMIAQDVVRTHRLAYGLTVAWRGRPTEVAVGETTAWRVLNNLVANACRASAPDGVVVVTTATSCEDDDGHVTIDDSGSGLAAIEGRIGLGLETVAWLVARAGGTFGLSPSHLGGTRASLTFPGTRVR